MNSTAASQPRGRNPWTFRWSHQAWLHRFLVKIYNAVFAVVPFSVKYGIGRWMRRNQYPYKLIQPGMTLVQIGAPVDTLRAGRSRGMYFSLFNGPTGKTVLIEPAAASKAAFTEIAKSRGYDDIIVCQSGAWNQQTTLRIYYDPKHPATNFTEGTVELSDDQLTRYEVVDVPCDTIDNLLAPHHLGSIDILSITTNGAEVEILEGMRDTIDRGVEFICLAIHEHLSQMPEVMRKLGYEQYALDDRGVTYRRIQGNNPG